MSNKYEYYKRKYTFKERKIFTLDMLKFESFDHYKYTKIRVNVIYFIFTLYAKCSGYDTNQ